MEINWFEIAKKICTPPTLPLTGLTVECRRCGEQKPIEDAGTDNCPHCPPPEHIDGECDQCGEEVDEDCNLCPRCIRNNARADAMDRKRDEQIERELEGKR